MRDAAPDHLHDIRRPGHPDPEVLTIEFVHEIFDAPDERLRISSWREDEDVARSPVFGNQQPAPERTFFRVVKIIRPVGQASDAGHRVEGCNPLGQPSQTLEVALPRDVRRRDAQNELAAGGEQAVDLARDSSSCGSSDEKKKC